ncbi:MAG TPA: DUF1361 domain-containing protein [bacterium]|nr:DUF1361 domain-containing protein [bacterium]
MDETSGKPGASVLLVVALSTLSCLVLVLVRYGLTGRFSQSYLIWNLVLATVPVLIARYGTMLTSRQTTAKRSRIFAVGSFVVWLVFYPNAPYVFTDFIHVVRRANLGAVALPWLSQADLLWYDIVMNAAFAFVCHYIGLVSMYIMHGAMRTMFGRVAGWSMMVPAILLSGFGIHIGRFSRFDSWDLVMQPVQTVRVISQSLADPAALLFSTAFAFFIALTYIIFYIVKKADLG